MDRESLTNDIWRDLEKIREQKPLVHNITNFVVMNTTANLLLSVGASPIMAHAKEELKDLLVYAGALVINIGTLDAEWVKSMHAAVEIAVERGLPIVLDPVGAGASSFRTGVAMSLMQKMKKGIIRGNASEVLALLPKGHEDGAEHKGVDSMHGSVHVYERARVLLEKVGAIIISGQTDIVITKEGVYGLDNGHPVMTYVTGLGCGFTSVVGAFMAVQEDMGQAALHGAAYYGVAGEVAASDAKAPGSFEVRFRDVLYSMERSVFFHTLKCRAMP